LRFNRVKMWGPTAYYMDHLGSGYEAYENLCEYGEGYSGEVDQEEAEEVQENCADASHNWEAPRCWHGSSCPFLVTGACQYYHPTEDYGAAKDVQSPSPPPKKRVASVEVGHRPCATPWNVLVMSGTAEAAKQTAEAEPQGKEESRHRSRSPRSKDDARRLAKESILNKARSMLADLRSKIEAGESNAAAMSGA